MTDKMQKETNLSYTTVKNVITVSEHQLDVFRYTQGAKEN